MERVIRTLFGRIQRYLTAKQTNKFTPVLQDIVRSYNETVHSSTNQKPNSVTKDTEQDLWEYAYKAYLKRPTSVVPKSRFQQGQKVRISKFKQLFTKGNFKTIKHYSLNNSKQTKN